MPYPFAARELNASSVGGFGGRRVPLVLALAALPAVCFSQWKDTSTPEGQRVEKAAVQHWHYWINPYNRETLWTAPGSDEGWWYRPPADGRTQSGFHATPAALAKNGKYRAVFSPIYVPTNPAKTFLIHGGWAGRVAVAMSKPVAAYGAVGMPGCQTAKSSVTETTSFSTASAMGRSYSDSQGGMYQNQLSYSMAVQNGFDVGIAKAAATATYGYAHTWGTTWDHTVENSWTDTTTFTHSFALTSTIAPGTIGVPSIVAPMVMVQGFHWLQTLDGLAGPKDGPPAFVSEWNNDGRKMYLGWLTVPVRAIDGPSFSSRPIWFIDSRLMTVEQYRGFCHADFLAHDYAPAMKATLCRRGVDKKHTCR